MIQTLTLSAMIGLFAAAAPLASPDPTLWANWGLAGLVIACVQWRDHQRERRMAAAIEAQQRWIRETLVDALERTATALTHITALCQRLEDGHADHTDRAHHR